MNKTETQKQLGYAISFSSEMDDIIKRVEPLVVGNLKQEIHDEGALKWALIGCSTAFMTIRKTLEYMQETAIQNYAGLGEQHDA